MLFDQGTLEKMTIRAYLPQACPDEPPQLSDDDNDTYVVQVNPSSFSLNHRLRYADRQGQGDSGSDAVYSGTEPTVFQFDFLFDGTGVVPPPPQLGGVPLVGALVSALTGSEEYVVMDEIQKFNRIVYHFDGEQHRPRKVLLVWGLIDLTCALTSLSYEFSLFKPDGTPLRAVAKCSFREARCDAERVREEDRGSPDLTHAREVVAGDTLPLIAHRIYGDAGLYLEVARVNRLVSFRGLRPGRQLRLPPVDKRGRGNGTGAR
jgi:hypothetical protein